MTTLLESAAHWKHLADECDSMDAHERSIGIFPSLGESANNHKARMYRRLAAAQVLEAHTGQAHCQNCLRPLHQGRLCLTKDQVTVDDRL